MGNSELNNFKNEIDKLNKNINNLQIKKDKKESGDGEFNIDDLDEIIQKPYKDISTLNKYNILEEEFKNYKNIKNSELNNFKNEIDKLNKNINNLQIKKDKKESGDGEFNIDDL